MIKKIIFSLFLSGTLILGGGCQILEELAKGAQTASNDPTTGEMSNGLKEALKLGAKFAVTSLSKDGGYFNNPKLRIPFPKEAQFVADKLRDLGMGKLVTDFEKRLNNGAEQGAKAALPIFSNAIQKMTFQDVKNVVIGGKGAATKYFKQKTTTALFQAFSPHIKSSLDKVNATQLWTKITTTYNSIPFVNKKVETDLVKYATNKALDGLFVKVEEEENKIRTKPLMRSTQLLKKVFSYADNYMK